ncbi:hypothetical protein Nepgr_009220 [Nepenthes gracilis]|uniref:Uncharacterized protein n=1 Tax=Nepenthes gracilis TaxID=150966 RepID=A0AAD3XK55_NEPGR|nr:hypothetical protein Nepgr_009220 [Nepenthes gracilis]
MLFGRSGLGAGVVAILTKPAKWILDAERSCFWCQNSIWREWFGHQSGCCINQTGKMDIRVSCFWCQNAIWPEWFGRQSGCRIKKTGKMDARCQSELLLVPNCYLSEVVLCRMGFI